ncbi:ABC transporter ATP-binding protein [Paeniglutamicibacter antarcticus]
MRVGAHVTEVMEVHSTVPGRAAAKKRVMIAMALANDPQLLLCAEPTTALDVTVQSKVLELISAQVSERGTGFLFITHGLTVVVNMCTRVLVLDKGPLGESGDIDRLITDPDYPYARALLAASNLTATDGQGRLFMVDTAAGYVRAGLRPEPAPAAPASEAAPVARRSGEPLITATSLGRTYQRAR